MFPLYCLDNDKANSMQVNIPVIHYTIDNKAFHIQYTVYSVDI